MNHKSGLSLIVPLLCVAGFSVPAMVLFVYVTNALIKPPPIRQDDLYLKCLLDDHAVFVAGDSQGYTRETNRELRCLDNGYDSFSGSGTCRDIQDFLHRGINNARMAISCRCFIPEVVMPLFAGSAAEQKN